MMKQEVESLKKSHRSSQLLLMNTLNVKLHYERIIQKLMANE